MGDLHIRPIPLCKGQRDRSQWTYRIGYGQQVNSCNYVWYIEGTGDRILVDCGADAGMFNSRGLPDNEIQTIESGLQSAGIEPVDVDLILLTHLHWDHVAFASRFKRAKFLVQKDELDFARAPHPAVAGGYDRELFDTLNFEVIDGDTEIAQGLSVISTPGHSPGLCD